MAITYILFRRITNKFYIGSSHENDVDVRLYSHNTGKVRSTKSGRPWTVVAAEIFENYTNARKRELFLKSGVGRKYINQKYGHFKDK